MTTTWRLFGDERAGTNQAWNAQRDTGAARWVAYPSIEQLRTGTEIREIVRDWRRLRDKHVFPSIKISTDLDRPL